MIRPAPATQPWPESTNWTAASAGAWPDPDPAASVAEAALPAHDEADAGDPAVPGELAEPGVDPVPALALGVPAGVLVAPEPDDPAAQPAAEPATASTASADTAARRVRAIPGAIGPSGRELPRPEGGATRAGASNVWFARALKGISFVTFQMTLYPLARLYRVPRVWSWG
jgi:hypothetical protein